MRLIDEYELRRQLERLRDEMEMKIFTPEALMSRVVDMIENAQTVQAEGPTTQTVWGGTAENNPMKQLAQKTEELENTRRRLDEYRCGVQMLKAMVDAMTGRSDGK